MQEEAVIVNTQYWVFSGFFKNSVIIYEIPKDVGCSGMGNVFASLYVFCATDTRY